MIDLQPPPKPLDHALIYCLDCAENKLGVIVYGYKAKCKVCGGYRTAGPKMARAYVTIQRRYEQEKKKAKKAGTK